MKTFCWMWVIKMFDNASVMILSVDYRGKINIYKLSVDRTTQQKITSIFSQAKSDLVDNKKAIPFDGTYKPEKNEFLYISDFKLDDKIMDAIRNPISIDDYRIINNSFPNIKAIFVGERQEDKELESFYIVFQLFRKEQRLSRGWLNLFFNNTTFTANDKFGFSISDTVECYYNKNRLEFQSFYFARQIFDLNKYYRLATDEEVKKFMENPHLYFEDGKGFFENANTWMRRRIALINDSKILEVYSTKEIMLQALNINITIEVKDNKLVIPLDKEKMKCIISFLDEEAYLGPFSNQIYITNSKRPVEVKD